MSRGEDYSNIKKSLQSVACFSDHNSIIVNSDVLDIISKIPTHSVSLILTDPPYHSTKKGNIIGDRAFKSDEDYIFWLEVILKEWKRILKPNGSIYCFCASDMSSKIEIAFSQYFNVLSHIVWTKPNEPGFDGWKQKMRKESLRQWYAHSERIIFAEPAMEGNLHRSYFGMLLRECRKRSGLSGHELTEQIGAFGTVNHGGAVSNWETGRNIPSREQYEKICDSLIATGKIDSMPIYEDVIRPFNVNSSKEFTDIWTFPSVKPYKGKHPAEKPLSMLEHAIESTTFYGDIVLDCFAGSGSTAFAALNLGRKSISIEIDKLWTDRIKDRLSIPMFEAAENQDIRPENIKPKTNNSVTYNSLFSESNLI